MGWRGGGAAMGYWEGGGGAVLCINSANQMHKGLYRCFLLKYPKKYLRPPTPPTHFQMGAFLRPFLQYFTNKNCFSRNI